MVCSFSPLTQRTFSKERLALENLHNTLRILRHNRAFEIQMFRFSSKLIPLFGIDLLDKWDPFPVLNEAFTAIGTFVRDNAMRVSFHPDHFTVLSTPRPDVLHNSIHDLIRHDQMLQAMGLDKLNKCNIHIGGAYGDKASAIERFFKHFTTLDSSIKERITLENDDKTFTALETLILCEKLEIPMVFDIHHHQVNNNREMIADLWARICQTWNTEDSFDEVKSAYLPPKIHVSSPKSSIYPRAHADYVDSMLLLAFMREIAPTTPRLDVMLEAKMKDAALIQLMLDLTGEDGIRIIDGASFEII